MKIEPFESTDIEALVDLQPADWGDLRPRFADFAASPFCHPIKISIGDQMVAVGTDICHRDSAWLACIIVHPEYRGQGLGTRITQALIDRLNRQTYPSIYLTATDIGFPVYRKLGFEVEMQYAFFQTPDEKPLPAAPFAPEVVPFEEKYGDAVLALDRQVSGEDRSQLLRSYLPSSQIWLNGAAVQGFYMPGLGDGLIVAGTPEAGTALMRVRLQQRHLALLPEGNTAGCDLLRNCGLTFLKTSPRMYLGKPLRWEPLGLYNRIGGHLG